ncbi:MAG: DUF6973 domain-containing protein [Acidimicrobiales bacterium]
MSLRASIRPALRSVARSPGHYSVARRAGAGRVQALRILHLTGLALVLSPQRAAGRDGRVNAVRHFSWQAAVTARHGIDLARALADAQEVGTADPADSALDIHNNAAGQAYGQVHPTDLAEPRPFRAVGVAIAAGLAAWDEGILAGGAR